MQLYAPKMFFGIAAILLGCGIAPTLAEYPDYPAQKSKEVVSLGCSNPNNNTNCTHYFLTNCQPPDGDWRCDGSNEQFVIYGVKLAVGRWIGTCIGGGATTCVSYDPFYCAWLKLYTTSNCTEEFLCYKLVHAYGSPFCTTQ